jgi:hypothetical protein
MVQAMPAESGGKSWPKEISKAALQGTDETPKQKNAASRGGGVLFDRDM